MDHAKQIDDLAEALASTESELRDAREALEAEIRSNRKCERILMRQRDATQAELALALWLLKRWRAMFDGGLKSGALSELWADNAGFLVRHAQAEEVTGNSRGPAQAEQQETQGAQAGEFQREDRYIVIKRKDLDRLPMEMRLPFSMALNELAPRLPKRECLVIESDWPEYEPTWAAIQARMTGQGAQSDYAAPHQIADALESLEWKGCSIGHKVVLANAVAALRATQPAEWIDPCPLTGVGKYYDQGFADGVAEAKRLNAVRGAEHDQ